MQQLLSYSKYHCSYYTYTVSRKYVRYKTYLFCVFFGNFDNLQISWIFVGALLTISNSLIKFGCKVIEDKLSPKITQIQ